MSDLTEADLDSIEVHAAGKHPSWPGKSFCRPEDTLDLVAEVRRLRGMVQGLADRVAAQS